MAIGYVAEHNRLPWKRLLFSRCYPMRAEEGVEVGAVDVEENALFLSMFEQSGAINKAAFIKNFLFQKPFKVFVVDENTRIFINQLSTLNALYRTYGVSYDTLVKTLRENFSEKKVIMNVLILWIISFSTTRSSISAKSRIQISSVFIKSSRYSSLNILRALIASRLSLIVTPKFEGMAP